MSRKKTLKFLKEKYKIALQIKDYERAKKFLLKIRKYENEKEIYELEKLKIKMKGKKCIFWKDGKCNSDYAKGLRCGGYAIVPKDCPYKI